MVKFHERVSRSLVKSLTFRCVVIISDFFVIFFITHKYALTIGVVIATNSSSMVLYFLHERMWNVIHWGKEKRSK